MPQYRATIGFNAFKVRYRPFEAENDEAAQAMRPQIEEWAREIMQEEADKEGNDRTTWEDGFVIVDAIHESGSCAEEVFNFDHPDSDPSADRLWDFARRIAALKLWTEGRESLADGGDTAALDEIIKEARLLSGREAVKEPKSQAEIAV
jgi:hypothetical protein